MSYIVSIEKKIKAGRKGVDHISDPENLVSIDLEKVARMRLHDVSKSDIALSYGISMSRLTKVIADNKHLLPYEEVEESEESGLTE